MIKTKDQLVRVLVEVLDDASEHPLSSLETAIDYVMEYIDRDDITARMTRLVECVHAYGTYTQNEL